MTSHANNGLTEGGARTSSGMLEPRPPPASCPMPEFSRKIDGERQRAGQSDEEASDVDLELGSAELEESVEELLSGPKDSVMMFASGSASSSSSSRRRSWLQFEHTGEVDPLDLLAKQFHEHQAPCKERPATARSPCMSASLSHSQELAYMCRNAIHRELDAFFGGAARHCADGSCGHGAPSAPYRQDSPDGERGGMAEQSGVWLQRDEVEAYRQASEEARSLRERVEVLEGIQQESARNQEEKLAALEAAARMEIDDLRMQVYVLEREKRDALDAAHAGVASKMDLQSAQKEVSSLQTQVQTLERANWALRGERDALSRLSGPELAELGEVLTDSLRRVHCEHQRRLERERDEQLCIACLSAKKNVVLQPCKHLTMCESCFNKCSTACPQCRAPVRGHLVIYM